MLSKRGLLLLCAASTVVFGSFGIGNARDLEEIKKAGTLVVATNPSYPPQSFVGKDGKLEGFDIDIATEIAKRLGVKVSFETPQWDLMTAGHWGNRWDVAVASMTPTKKRSAVLAFPAVYYFEQVVAAVYKGSPYKSVKDLSGKAIGVNGATTYEDYLNRKLSLQYADNISYKSSFEYLINDPKVSTYSDEAVAMDDLKLGDGVRISAMLSSKVAMQTAIDHGYPFRILDEVLFSVPQAIAVEKDNTSLDSAIAAAVTQMRAEGLLSTLSKKWHKTDLTNPG